MDQFCATPSFCLVFAIGWDEKRITRKTKEKGKR